MVLPRRSWATLAAAVASSRTVYGNYEAGTVMSVTPEASVFDTRSTLPYGCPPDGCVAANTRDGDMSDESRWSCRPSLDASGSGCSITFTLEKVEYLGDIRIALYKGDTRTRTIDMYVDGRHITTWTSSGTTTGFESVLLMDQGQVVELVGDLNDDEWLSILEVEIDVDDGIVDDDTVVVLDVVEAAEMGTVTATADLYDTRLGDTVGCDPEGCTAALTRDGDMSEGSRWSCAPKLGGPCSISYDLGAEYNVEQLRLRMYRGDSRTRTVDVSVDGALVTTWTSSGTTTEFESVDLSGAYGQVVTISGSNQADSQWLSIIETEIMVYEGDAPAPSPTTPPPVVMPMTPSPVSPTAGINPCFDSTNDDYRCQPSVDQPAYIDLNNCNFVDSDAADLPACFESFGKTDIETLHLTFHDDLTTLPAGVFEGLENVVDMDMSYTGLEYLPAGVFSGLSGLTKLSMHFSSIEGLHEDLFADTPLLESLEVSSAKLSTLPAGVFEPLTNLQSLTLSSRFDDVQLQCLPSSTATEISLWGQLEVEEAKAATCECEPAEAVYCETGTTCQPGVGGYTCE
ncbi:unnamed protein product [Ectocarpus sp. CCAP 1310/34]|nr:unnamed protein product [Ectocarpus sp. CCAP 1310/34]